MQDLDIPSAEDPPVSPPGRAGQKIGTPDSPPKGGQPFV